MKSIKTKFNAAIMIFLLVLMSYTVVLAVTRTISPTQDEIYTYIRNSLGSYWEPSQSNLQDAFWELNDTGGWVSYPGSTSINISGTPLDIPDDVDFEGGGASSELRTADGADIDIMTLNGRHNITIRHLRFNVNNFTQNAYVNAISMGASQWTSNVTIFNCWFVHGNASLIDAEEFTYNIVVDTCFFDEIEDNIYNRAATFDGNKDMYPAGIWFSGYDCIAKNNFIRDTFACGIVMEAGTGDPSSLGHLIEGNTITGRVSHGIHMEGPGSQAYYKAIKARIVNNWIYDCNSTAYEYTDPGYGKGILLTENSTCIGNHIENSPDHAIEIDGNNTLVADNIIEGVQNAHAIRTTGENYTVRIVRNEIKHVVGGSAIHLDSTYGWLAIVSENIIEEVTDDGINCGANILIAENNFMKDIGDTALTTIPSSSNVTFSGNTIINCGGTYALYGACEAMIKDNWFYDSPSYCMYFTDDADNCQISGNHIIGVATNDGIHFRGENSKIHSNIIRGQGALEGIQLHSAYNNTVYWNTVAGFTNGIKETDLADYNKILFNDPFDCTNPTVIIGANTKVNMTGEDNWNFV